MDNTSSTRDVELLGALASNDSGQFQLIVKTLEEEAREVAGELLGGPNVEDAVSAAIDKVTNWLMSDKVFEVNHPYHYARQIIRNGVIDYARTNTEKAIPKEQIKRDLAWLDEGMGYFENDEVDDEQETPSGWHGVKVKTRDSQESLRYPEHNLLRALRSLDSLHIIPSPNKLWARYELINTLVDSIPSSAEQVIIKHFLWGFRVTDITTELDVSKAYVSRVTTKWLYQWQWTKPKIQENRMILLTYFLATRAYLTGEKLYHSIRTGKETKAYFHNLRESDGMALSEVCDRYKSLWYQPRYLKTDYIDDENDDAEQLWRTECIELLRTIPVEGRPLYIDSWKRQTRDRKELKFLNELKEVCHLL